jgi:tetratricopeptide (TPR) repeat protein
MQPTETITDQPCSRPAASSAPVSTRSVTAVALATGLVAGGLILATAGCQPTNSGASGLKRPRGVEGYIAGVESYQKGDKDAAVKSLLEATEQNPNLINARVLLGDLYRNEGEYRAALEQYEAVVKLDPYEAANFTRLGIAYQFLDRLREAETAYLRSLELKSNSEAAMNLGLVYLALSKLDEAKKYTLLATELDPTSAVAHANYGVVLDASGDHAGAERALLKALEIAPANPGAMMNLATALLAQKRASDAAAILENLVEVNDTAPVRKRLGDAYALSERLNQALTQYDAAIAKDPRFTSAYNDAGRVLILQYRQGLELDEKLRDAAIARWKKSLEINPNQTKVKDLIAEWEKKGV